MQKIRFDSLQFELQLKQKTIAGVSGLRICRLSISAASSHEIIDNPNVEAFNVYNTGLKYVKKNTIIVVE